MAKKIIKIGTRESPLAQWQANKVQSLLSEHQLEAILFPVSSSGDKDLITPLYAMGVQGVFTKHLDAHLLQGDIDIAVHSMKDVPTQLAKGLKQVAVLPRAVTADVLIVKKDRWSQDNDQWNYIGSHENEAFYIGTGSVRRTAAWLHRYPNSTIDNLRGNVQTRLRKLEESDWDGAIFAAAGLERMTLLSDNAMMLDWMLPAPAQGAIVVVCREEDQEMIQACSAMNDPLTDLCVKVERDFLSTLMGGCSTPIGALARIEEDRLDFRGNIYSPNGQRRLDIVMNVPLADALSVGILAARKIIEDGAGAIIEEIRNFEKKS